MVPDNPGTREVTDLIDGDTFGRGGNSDVATVGSTADVMKEESIGKMVDRRSAV